MILESLQDIKEGKTPIIYVGLSIPRLSSNTFKKYEDTKQEKGVENFDNLKDLLDNTKKDLQHLYTGVKYTFITYDTIDLGNSKRRNWVKYPVLREAIITKVTNQFIILDKGKIAKHKVLGVIAKDYGINEPPQQWEW